MRQGLSYDVLTHSRRAQAALKELWDSDHWDRRGIWQAIEDNVHDECLILLELLEGGMMMQEILDRDAAKAKPSCTHTRATKHCYECEPDGPTGVPLIRRFETGATRDTTEGKPEYGGFLSPLVLEAYGAYMHKHRHQADGTLRDAGNWKRGMPDKVYYESAYRHLIDWSLEEDGYLSRDGLEDALCALLFNVQGRLHNLKVAQKGATK